MKIIISLFIISLFTMKSFAQVDDAKSGAILDKVSAQTKTYSNMKFKFTYIMTDKKNKINDSLQGDIVMSGNKFNLNFMNRKIVSDGKTVWTYDPDAEEIQINVVKEDQDAFNPGKILTAYDKSFKTKLIKTITIAGIQYNIIDLYPKKGKSYFKIRVKVKAKAFRIVEAIIFNKDNVEYKYRVNQFVPNVKIPATYVTLDPKKYPKAEVVDLR